MLSESSIMKIRELLDSAQNPLFFFDNDTDGLASFLLLRRRIGRGKGVAIKSYPDLNASYIRKLSELNPDVIFITDKPLVSKEFIDACLQMGIKIVWLDHHPAEVTDNPEVNYFNPLLESPASNEPVSYWSYVISGRKEDMWIGMF